ncbi:MAG TPA: hypothetical protein VGC97_09480 [Pyrinomonadaceae bacterium]|jgi:hypothetical protein
MAKDTITVGGEDRVVREDTAKSYRGTIWALLSILAFVIIMAIVFLGGFIGGAKDGDMKSPAQVEQKRQ